VRRPAARLLISLGIGLAVSLAALGLQASGLLLRWELPAVDLMMALRGRLTADPRVVICAVDAASIDRYGQWPWSRARMAGLVDRLAAAGARVLAFDVVFSEPSRADEVVDLTREDEALAAALARAGNAVLGYYFRRDGAEERAAGTAPPGGGDPANLEASAVEQVLGEPSGGFAVVRRQVVEPNLDLFAAAAASQGFFSTEGRRGGVTRSYDLVVAYGDRYYPALALRAVALAAGATLRLEPGTGTLPRLLLGGRLVETDDRGALWLTYLGPAGTFPTFSAADVLEDRFAAGTLDGKIVFFGATEPGIGDLNATPFGGEVPGVEVHATAADNLLAGRSVYDGALQGTLSLAALLLLGPLVALAVAGIRRYALAVGLAAALLLAWPAAAYAAFRSADWHLALVGPAASGLLALVATLAYRLGFADRQARWLRGTFSRYVSPAVVAELTAHPERVRLGGERREMTVLFADLRGFTTVAEGLDPVAVTRLLNRFFTPTTRRVLAAGGTLDKYMGDALMAFFGAPLLQADHARRACRAALGLSRELVRLNAEPPPAGARPGPAQLAIGVGIASGEMVVGNLGSEEVFDYTVVGDTVNLGSRIEGLNRLYGTEILVSDATAAAAREEFLFREVDRVRVKGKRVPVSLFELVAEAPGEARQRQRVERFEVALEAYRKRDFSRARQLFTSLLGDFSDDGPAHVYVERCRHFLATPPPDDWDAVETLTSK
jgi:adenylate cyclase